MPPYGNEYGVAEVALGAAAPIILEQFIDALRFEMEADKKSLEEALKTAAEDFVLAFPGFGADRYRSGVKMPPMGGSAPHEPPKNTPSRSVSTPTPFFRGAAR